MAILKIDATMTTGNQTLQGRASLATDAGITVATADLKVIGLDDAIDEVKQLIASLPKPDVNA